LASGNVCDWRPGGILWGAAGTAERSALGSSEMRRRELAPRRPESMQIPEAKQYLGRHCEVTFRDRRGDEITKNLHVHDVQFVPLYGAYLIGDIEDVCLDRVTSISALE
jgi:hypothetical protein